MHIGPWIRQTLGPDQGLHHRQASLSTCQALVDIDFGYAGLRQLVPIGVDQQSVVANALELRGQDVLQCCR